MTTEPTIIYTGAADENMYGCRPCPRCGDKYRCAWPRSGMIECDECGFTEPYKILEREQ